jgi:hypothetical protein
MAYMSALNIGALNRLPDSLMVGVARMLGAPVDEGSRATMDVEITAVTNAGASIPAGTLFGYELTIDDQVLTYAFSTDEVLTIAAVAEEDPLPTGVVGCTSLVLGVIPPIEDGQELNILGSTPSILSVTCDGEFSNGTNAETTDQSLSRLITYIASLTNANATSGQLESYLKTTYPDLIKRVKIYDLTDPDGALEVDEADTAGYVTIFGYGPNRFLTETEKTDILSDVENRTVAGLTIGVLDPPILNFIVNASIEYNTSFTSESVEDAVKSNLVEAYGPLKVQYVEEVVRYNGILKLLLDSQGVVHVTELTLETAKTDSITNATVSSGTATYTSTSHNLIVGDVVTVTGITPGTLNIADKTITAVTTSTFSVASSGASGAYSSGGTYTVTYSGWGTPDGDNLTFSNKGSLTQLDSDNIFLTLTEFEV